MGKGWFNNSFVFTYTFYLYEILMLWLHEIHTVIVWSTNPVKIQWVKDLFSVHMWGICNVSWVAAPSDVSDMPKSLQETKKWAKNRALWCKENISWDFFVWWEWGISIDENKNCRLFNCMCFIDSTGYIHEVIWTQFMLPPIMSQRILSGEELGPIGDDLLGVSDIKKKWWVVWFLTWNKVPRQKSYLHTAHHALAPWLHPDLYS